MLLKDPIACLSVEKYWLKGVVRIASSMVRVGYHHFRKDIVVRVRVGAPRGQSTCFASNKEVVTFFQNLALQHCLLGVCEWSIMARNQCIKHQYRWSYSCGSGHEGIL